MGFVVPDIEAVEEKIQLPAVAAVVGKVHLPGPAKALLLQSLVPDHEAIALPVQ
jgi:hypothetical protein